MSGKVIKWDCSFRVFERDSELAPIHQELLSKAREIAKYAYAPYSHFHVGAAILLKNGTIVVGCNQENAAFPLGTCAEQVALHNAASNYPGERMMSMAVYAETENVSLEKPVSPCGACRQVITEYEHIQHHDIEIFLFGKNSPIFHVESGKTLLPFHFDAAAFNPPKDS